MQTNEHTPAVGNGLSTESLARAIDGKAASIRVRLCQTGSYYGIRPIKLLNGRLLWPADSVERLVKGDTCKSTTK